MDLFKTSIHVFRLWGSRSSWRKPTQAQEHPGQPRHWSGFRADHCTTELLVPVQNSQGDTGEGTPTIPKVVVRKTEQRRNNIQHSDLWSSNHRRAELHADKAHTKTQGQCKSTESETEEKKGNSPNSPQELPQQSVCVAAQQCDGSRSH